MDCDHTAGVKRNQYKIVALTLELVKYDRYIILSNNVSLVCQ